MAPDRDQNEPNASPADDPRLDDASLPLGEPQSPASPGDHTDNPTTPPPRRPQAHNAPPSEITHDDDPTLTLNRAPKARHTPQVDAQTAFSLPASAATDDDTTKPLGTIAGGKYRILDQLGKGGMGVVYRARDVHLDRDVAVKRINSTELGDEEAIQRFMREARAIAQLTHHNIVSIFTLERDNAGPFIVMEHIKGKDVASLVTSQGALELEQALNIVSGVGNALAFAHNNAIYHRDVKPSNILIDEDGTPKLVDFGLAKMDRDTTLSQTGMGMGTLTYVAPEQIDDASSVDQRADIYSLAKTAYHLFTGERPDAPDLDRLPEQLRPPLRKAMQARPERRHFAISEFLEELDEGTKSALRGDPGLSTTSRLGAGSSAYQQISCPSCNVNNPMSARFCRACGHGLRTPCPRCNHTEIAGANHCSSCGLNFEGSAKSLQLLESGREKLEKGLFLAAIEDIDRGIALGHDVEQLRELRARAARLQNELDDIIEPAREATANNNPEAAYTIITTAQSQAFGPLQAALTHELEAAERARDDAEVRQALQQAAALEREGRLFEAIAALKRGYALRPDDTAIGSRIATLERTNTERIAQSIRQRTAQLLKAREFEQALAGVDAAIERLGDGPVYAELDKLRNSVAETIVNTRLAEARRAEQATDPTTVRAHARGVLAVEPRHREAARLLKSADQLDRAVRVVTTKAHELLDDARPESARDLIAEHVPAAETTGPFAELREQALARVEQATAHAHQAQRLLEHRQFSDARAEADAATKLNREDTATLELHQAIENAANDARKRTKALAGGITVAAVAAILGAFVGAQAWRASAIATARDSIEASNLADARAALIALPSFLQSATVAELLETIESGSAARSVDALIARLDQLTQTPTPEATNEAAAIAGTIAESPASKQPLADAFTRAAQAVLIADHDPEALFRAADRLTPTDPPMRAVATQQALRELLRRAGPSTTPSNRAETLGIAARLAAQDSPPYLTTPLAPIAANAALNRAAAERARAIQELAAAIKDDAPQRALEITETARPLLELSPARFAATNTPGQLQQVIEAHTAFQAVNAAQANVQSPLARELAAPEQRAARTIRDDALAAARADDWTRATQGFQDAATALERLQLTTNKRFKDRLDTIARRLERRKLAEAQTLIAPLLRAAPNDKDVAQRSAQLEQLRTQRVTLPGNVTLDLHFVHNGANDSDTTPFLASEFYLAATEVTREQFAAVMGTPSPDNPDLPRTNVSYEEATAFCDALADFLPQGVVRLPTPREFTLACELGKSDPGTAWHEGNSGLKARPVATSPESDLGLHDLLGNTAEWLADDPGTQAPFRKVAGGHFRKTLQFLECGTFDRVTADASSDTIGFRVLWDPPASGSSLDPTEATSNPDP